jgi:hypothetical protein
MIHDKLTEQYYPQLLSKEGRIYLFYVGKKISCQMAAGHPLKGEMPSQMVQHHILPF